MLRTLKNKAQKNLSNQLILSPNGRKVLKTASILSKPNEFIKRWQVAQQLKKQNDLPQIKEDSGVLAINPSIFPEIPQMVDLCRSIYNEKAPSLDAIRPQLKRKNAFFTELLSDSDLELYPQLVDFALNPKLLTIISNYFNTFPVLKRVGIMVSSPSVYDETMYSQFYHYDHGDFKQIKLFLNITDVLPENGPFTCMPANVSKRVTDQLDREISQGVVQQPEIGRYTDEDVYRCADQSNLITGVGPSGTGLIVDTSRCLHYGSRVKTGVRVSLLLNYYTYHTLVEMPTNVFNKSRYATDPLKQMALANRKKYNLNHFYAGFHPDRRR